MTDHDRFVLEQLAVAAADGIEAALGRGVEIGLHGRFDDTEVLNRPMPLRAIQVSYTSGLDDCLIAITTMRDEHARSGAASAAMEIANQLGIPVEVAPPLSYEFDDRDDALEQMEALYQEPTLLVHTKVGDLLLVFGSGLVASAARFVEGAIGAGDQGAAPAAAPAADPYADDPFFDPAADAPAEAVDPMLSAALGEPAPVAADARPAELVDFAAADAAMGDTARENALAAAEADRWSSLLSGVEVEISAELGRTGMRLGDAAALADDSVLTLDRLVDDPVTVYVNGSLFATARLVVVNDEYGIEIIEVLEPDAVHA